MDFPKTEFTFDSQDDFDKAALITEKNLHSIYYNIGYSDKIISIDNECQFRIFEMFVEKRIKI